MCASHSLPSVGPHDPSILGSEPYLVEDQGEAGLLDEASQGQGVI